MHRFYYALFIAVLLLQMFIPSSAYLQSNLPTGKSYKAGKNIALVNSLPTTFVNAGGPKIDGLSKNTVRLEGGEEIIVTGQNFSLDTQLTLGDSTVKDFTIVSSKEIRLKVPKQRFIGGRTLTLMTKEGIDQRLVNIIPKSLSELKDGEATIIAGGITYLGDGALATSSSVSLSPSFITTDLLGNIFFIDKDNQRVRRIDINTGIITSVAGSGAMGFNGDKSLAIAASLNFPEAVAVDKVGNLFISDTENGRIRRVDANTGIITSIAGSGEFGFGGDGGLAINAKLNRPKGVTIDNLGNLLVADTDNNRIRQVDLNTGIITSVVGGGERGSNGFSGDGGLATSASLDRPNAVAVDKVGNLFIVDTENHRIRRVDSSTKIITTVAGNGDNELNGGFSGDGGPATSASLSRPETIAIDKTGNIFIVDRGNNRTRRIDINTGIITTFAGNGIFGVGGDGGPAINAILNSTAVALDIKGNLLIADEFNLRIRQVDVNTGIITTFAGGANRDLKRFSGDGGLAINARFNSPRGVVIDQVGNLFIADTRNNRVRRLDARTGIITTIAGTGRFDFDGDGLATNSSLNFPQGMLVDNGGNLFVADTFNSRVRRVDVNVGVISTIAGTIRGFAGDGGLATSARFLGPVSVTTDQLGNLFIADSGNNRIRRLDARTRIITTVAGSNSFGSFGGRGDGDLATKAELFGPQSVAVDPAGNLFIADTFNQRIRRADASTGIITTVAGKGLLAGEFGGDGGSALNAILDNPHEVILDTEGNLIIADSFNGRVRKVDASTGIINTIVGGGDFKLNSDEGLATTLALVSPIKLALDREGNLFITDEGSNKVLVVKAVAKVLGTQRQVTIINATATKSSLTINGKGFTIFGANVKVNGTDVSKLVDSKADNQITLKGTRKKLALKKGANSIVVSAAGSNSNVFTFNFFAGGN